MPLRLPIRASTCSSGASSWARWPARPAPRRSAIRALVQAAMPELNANQKHILDHLAGRRLEPVGKLGPQAARPTPADRSARFPPRCPALHISELLPYTAKQMHHLAIVRSVNTKEDDHGKGALLHDHRPAAGPGGRLSAPGRRGAPRCSRRRTRRCPATFTLPRGGGGGTSNDAAFLGPKYASITLGNGNPPQNTARPDGLTEAADRQRNAFRRQANDHFARRRRTADTDAFTSSFEQAQQLMERRDVFDVTKEPAADLERYGTARLRPALPARPAAARARRHLRAGDPLELRHAQREFRFPHRAARRVRPHVRHAGRRPGRPRHVEEHAARRDVRVRPHAEDQPAISAATTGAPPGAWCWAAAAFSPARVIGKTNDNGTAVADRQVDHGHLFHTYLRAVGVDPTGKFDIGGRSRSRSPIRRPSRSRSCWHERDAAARRLDVPRQTAPGRASSSTPARCWLAASTPAASSCSPRPTTTRSSAGNLATGKATPLVGHESWVRTLALHPSGSTLYSGGYDGRVIWWDVTAEDAAAAAHDRSPSRLGPRGRGQPRRQSAGHLRQRQSGEALERGRRHATCNRSSATRTTSTTSRFIPRGRCSSRAI